MTARKKVLVGSPTLFTVNAGINDPDYPDLNKTAHFKIYNADYKEFNHVDNEMHAVGTARFIYL